MRGRRLTPSYLFTSSLAEGAETLITLLSAAAGGTETCVEAFLHGPRQVCPAAAALTGRCTYSVRTFGTKNAV